MRTSSPARRAAAKPTACAAASLASALALVAALPARAATVRTGSPASAEAAASAPRAAAPLPFFKRSREGWFWYQDPPEAPAEDEPTQDATPPPALTGQARDLRDFADFKARLERALNAATQNPSEANVAELLELYAQARRKASVLGDTAEALAVRMPWIDESVSGGGRPSTPSAMRAFDQIALQDRDQLLIELARSHGLYFFFRGNCAYCHLQAPALLAFSRRYGMTVFAVSLDGSTLAEFPQARRDNGFAQQVASVIGVPMDQFVVPAVVLARPATGSVVPVGFGAMNLEEMADRIATVVRVRDQGAGQAPATVIEALTGAPPAARAVELAARGRR